jgi:hypothetical protein
MPVDLDTYLPALAARVSSAQMLKRGEIDGGDWQPKPNECHENATTWSELKEGFTPVRGWLYFGEAGLLVAHSVVRAPDGDLYDLTPSEASKDYPFLESALSEEDYGDLIVTRGISQLWLHRR